MLKTYAVWAANEHRVLFYGSDGSRFGETKMSEAPDVRELEKPATEKNERRAG